MKVFAIGDIHGCNMELNRLIPLIEAEVKAGDKVVFLGDYIDRGPDSYGVIETILGWASRMSEQDVEFRFLMGNHEDMMMNDYNMWLFNGGYQTYESYLKAGEDVGNLPHRHKDFYRNLEYSAKFGRFVFVHAGLDPTMMLDAHTKSMLLWSRNHVGYDGDYLGGHFVVYGHTPTDKVIRRRNQLDIDTACVFGGKLTCAAIDVDTEVINLIQVNSEKNYYK